MRAFRLYLGHRVVRYGVVSFAGRFIASEVRRCSIVPDVDVNTRILEGTSAIIESYNNSQYYTKPGMQGGEYVAYVYDDLKIRNVDTLVPNLSVFYVKTAEDGTLYLYRGDYNPQNGSFVMYTATQDYIQSLYNDSDVADLIATVNTKLESACAKDSKVMDFVDQIRGRTGVEPTPQTDAASETETAGASETETETVTETETETEAEVAE
jgi:hypothetical protein